MRNLALMWVWVLGACLLGCGGKPSIPRKIFWKTTLDK
jgi:hypothetical protein